MTSQDRPLTRRELRERERLLEQQAASASPQTDAPAPAFPVSPPPQAAPAFPPAQRPADQRPTDQRPANGSAAEEPPAADTPTESPSTPPAPAFAPRAAGSAAATGSPFAGPVATPIEPSDASTEAEPADARPADSSPFAPPATGQRWSRPPTDDDDATPERTLTRRELRALIDASRSAGDADDAAADEDDEVEAATPAPARVVTPPQPITVRSGDDSVSKPLGHWTSQLDLPDTQPEPFDQLLARGAGGAHGVPTTTSALILPSMPSAGGLGQPLPDGAEIMVTGSIDLPRSFGATGLHPSQLDSSDVDRLIDHIEDTAGGGAAPVSASRAVSTQGHPRDMIAPPKKEGVSAPLVLAVTAGVLALGVVASLVVGAMVGIF